ncbi:MAG: hypothetical protein QOJ07_2490 [Thermoleophilaceae bacterium]|nr:hypothetical protein [Thermoleophilaceae bacterium]
MAYLAYHDPLTHLPNRALLHERLTEALAAASSDGTAVVLVYVDLNDFKLVNDSLGHAAGDELLCQVADRLRAVVRPTDFIARQGGDEFLVLLRGMTRAQGRAAAERVCRAITSAFSDSFTIGHAEFEIGASAGISLFPADAADAEALHKHADAAMYRAKDAGWSHALYEPAATDPLARLSLAARMRRALAAEEFELHYQPIWSLGGVPAVRGVEALIRWRDPERGLIPPLEFIPVAEQTGVIDAIGDWVIDTMLDQAREWLDAGLSPNVAFNVSPRQLRRSVFAERLLDGIRARALPPNRIVVELTESAWMLDAARALPVLTELRDAGLPLALDDFGAGYSSLARLRALPVGIIKIDRAFMDGVPEDPQACAIVAAILQLAAACGCDVVAEGIETAGQMTFLTDNGCWLGQGYHLARPMTASAMTDLLHEHVTAERRA